VISRLQHWRHTRLVLTLLVAVGYAVFATVTGLGDAQKAWIDKNPAVGVALRVLIILFLVAGGFAWLVQPSRKPNGRPTVGSRLLVLFAFAMAGGQLAVIVLGNPFH